MLLPWLPKVKGSAGLHLPNSTCDCSSQLENEPLGLHSSTAKSVAVQLPTFEYRWWSYSSAFLGGRCIGLSLDQWRDAIKTNSAQPARRCRGQG